jgi:hypothetical protein
MRREGELACLAASMPHLTSPSQARVAAPQELAD